MVSQSRNLAPKATPNIFRGFTIHMIFITVILNFIGKLKKIFFFKKAKPIDMNFSLTVLSVISF